MPLLSAVAWLGVVAALGVGLVALGSEWGDRLVPGMGRSGLARGEPARSAAHLLEFMCSTFAYHAGLAMLPAAALAVAARRRRLLAASLVAFALAAGPELVPALGRLARAGAGGGRTRGEPTLKVMSVNLMYGRMSGPKLLAQIEREAPDVVLFQEWTPEGDEKLAERLRAMLPHSFEQPRDDAFGQAVFSRRPFVAPARAFPPSGSFADPAITVGIEHDGRTMRLTDVHLLPPVSVAFHRRQRAGARALAEWVVAGPDAGAPDVLAGDFNAVGRSAVLRALTRTGLREAHAEAGAWRGSTWPRRGTLRLGPGIRIDHALLGPRVRCVAARTGDDVGSDHRPLIVELTWSGVGAP